MTNEQAILNLMLLILNTGGEKTEAEFILQNRQGHPRNHRVLLHSSRKSTSVYTNGVDLKSMFHTCTVDRRSVLF